MGAPTLSPSRNTRRAHNGEAGAGTLLPFEAGVRALARNQAPKADLRSFGQFGGNGEVVPEPPGVGRALVLTAQLGSQTAIHVHAGESLVEHIADERLVIPVQAHLDCLTGVQLIRCRRLSRERQLPGRTFALHLSAGRGEPVVGTLGCLGGGSSARERQKEGQYRARDETASSQVRLPPRAALGRVEV